MFKLLHFGGNPNVGVYARATERHVLASPHLSKRELQAIAEALEVPTLLLHIGGSNIVGSLLAANSHGAVVPEFSLRAEVRTLERAGLRVHQLKDALNAAGNNLLVNDRGGVANPEFSDRALQTIEQTLGVSLVRATLAGLGTVGMAGVATPRGVLVHPKATPEEREAVRRALHADVQVGTVNRGTGLIGAGLVANSKGALIGAATTGIEISRIEDALGFLEAPIG